MSISRNSVWLYQPSSRGLAGLLGLELGQLFGGVIDQGGQLGPLVGGHLVPQHLVHFFADHPRAEFRMWTNASFSPCRSLIKCSVPLGSLSSAWVLMISLAAAAWDG